MAWVVAGGRLLQLLSALTRYSTVPCAGTVALIVPAVSVVVPAQRSLSENALARGSPIWAAVVLIVAAASFELYSATARSPLASGLLNTLVPLPCAMT